MFQLQGRRKKSSSIQVGKEVARKTVVAGEGRIKPALRKHSTTGHSGTIKKNM